MNPELLQKIGLNEAQANVYLELIRGGEQSPPDLATKTGESRTNIYMILDRLVDLGLASKKSASRKTTYLANNPVSLERLSEARRREVMQAELQVKTAMPQLLNYFYTFSEQPGVRFYQGKDELIKIYEDILRTGKDVYLIRTPQEVRVLGGAFMKRYIDKRVALGIKVKAITPDVPGANHDPATDEAWLMERTWIAPDQYSAPVEINIYGNKVAYISFGEEVMGTIIESPQIALAMKQLFGVMARGLRAAPDGAGNQSPA